MVPQEIAPTLKGPFEARFLSNLLCFEYVLVLVIYEQWVIFVVKFPSIRRLLVAWIVSAKYQLCNKT